MGDLARDVWANQEIERLRAETARLGDVIVNLKHDLLARASEEASDKLYPPLWLIWAMSDRSPEYHLRAICTSQSITDQKRKYIAGLEEIVHARVNKVCANHLFGDGMIRQV